MESIIYLSIYLSNLCKHKFIIIRGVCVHDGGYICVVICLSRSETVLGVRLLLPPWDLGNKYRLSGFRKQELSPAEPQN